MNCHHVDEIEVCETRVEITFYGRNSNGTKQRFKIEMDRAIFFWFINVRCREAVKSIKDHLMNAAHIAANLFNETPF